MLSPQQVEALRVDGYVLIRSFAPADETTALRDAVLAGVAGQSEPITAGGFPFADDRLNDVPMRLADVAEQLLSTSDIALTQSIVWAKRTGQMDFEQELHADYNNNTFLAPDDDRYRQLASILYYTDVTEAHGPTHVVSHRHVHADDLLWPHHRGREAYPELYANEVSVLASAGDLLLYTMRTWHRGSAMTAPDGVRVSHHNVFRPADAPWMGWTSWAPMAQQHNMVRFLVRATPRERELLGWPPPGHPYWTPRTIAATAARYEGIDLEPYAAPSPSGVRLT